MKHIHRSIIFAGLLGAGFWANAQVFVNHTVVQAAQLVADAGQDLAGCDGDSIQLGGTPAANGGTSPFTYSWSPSGNLSDPTASNPSALTSGTQIFTLIVTDANGCTDLDSMQLSNNAVSAGFSFSANLLNVQFTNSSAGASSYFWDFGDGSTTTLSNPSHLYATAGSYLVCLTANPGAACEDSTCITITVTSVSVNPALASSILVYPNPSAGADLHFAIQGLQSTEDIRIDLMDVQGKMVRQYSGAASTAVHVISRNGLAMGSYQYVVRSGNELVATGKVILE